MISRLRHRSFGGTSQSHQKQASANFSRRSVRGQGNRKGSYAWLVKGRETRLLPVIRRIRAETAKPPSR